MQSPTPEIRQALYRHLLCALPIQVITDQDVAWPNAPFKPDIARLYIKPICLFGKSEMASLSGRGFERLSGVFQITIYGILNTGEAMLDSISREVTDLFRAGTRITVPDANPVAFLQTYRSALVIDTAGAVSRPAVTVSANWQQYASRGE